MKNLTNRYIIEYLDNMSGTGSKNVVVVDHVRKAIYDTIRYFIGFDESEETIPEISYDTIIQKVSAYTLIPVSVIKSKTRDPEVIKARHFAIYFGRMLTKKSYQKLSDGIRLRSSAAAIHAYKKIRNRYGIYNDVRKDVDRIMVLILVKE